MSSKSERRRVLALHHDGWAHGRKRQLDIRTGDTVVVLTGKDRGKRGVVERTMADQQRVVVGGVNMAKRHSKAGVKGNVQGGIVDFNASVSYSNVTLICNRCDKPTRIAKSRQENGQWVIVCKQCGEVHERATL